MKDNIEYGHERLKNNVDKEATQEEEEQKEDNIELTATQNERDLKGAQRSFAIPGLPKADINGYLIEPNRVSRC